MIKVILSILLFCGAVNAQEIVKLGTANTVVMRGEISDESAQKISKEVLRLSALRGDKDYPIYLVMDTPGGSIDAGEALIETLKTVPNLETITFFAASMGSAIVQALPGQRLMVDSGVQMFHRAKGGVRGQFETGELETRLDFYKRFVRRMEKRNAKRMGLSLPAYKKAVKDELWVTADGGAGFVSDKTVAVQCSQALIDKRERQTVDVFIFKIELEYSGCPLFRVPDVLDGQEPQAIQAYNKYRADLDLQITMGLLTNIGGLK